MKNLLARLNLVQKVTVTIVVLFVITCTSMALVVSQVIRQSYLNEQKRSVSQFVLKQAAQYLTVDDLDPQKTDLKENQEKFDTFRSIISTPDVVNVTIFNTEGKILSSDDPTLTGRQLTAGELNNSAQVFGGATTANIDKPILEGDQSGSKYGQMLRIYTPLIFDDVNVVGAVETSIQLASLNSEIARSQSYALGVLTAIISLTFITLYIIIRRASFTLVRQQKQLRLDIEKEQEYSRLKNEFIALASHQLRTPATSILWSLEVLREDIENKLNSKQKEMVNSAQTASETLVAIVNNMLIVADIKPDYFIYEARYPLEDLVRKILDTYKKYLSSNRREIVFQNEAAGVQLNLKRSALSLVIESIYKNAIDYSHIDSVITITLISQPNAAQIEITDSGIGIPVAERGKVFEQFFRASNSIEQKNVGSGLSLYIAHKIVTGYGGTLHYTALEKGSKFTISIPLAHTN